MSKPGRFCCSLTVLFCSVLIVAWHVHGAGYQGFSLLSPDECDPLDKNIVLKLPAEWHKYAGFTRICELKQKKGSPAKVLIISVWAHDYYATLPKGTLWEDLPRPIIVDNTCHQIGMLPEVYPADPPRDLDVYFGRWGSGIPTEIRVDAHNPALDGNYFYAPLRWNKKSGCYEMKSKEVTSTPSYSPPRQKGLPCKL
jgi:hypothetical protein